MSDTEAVTKVQPAIDQLRNHQQQLDMDGIFVGVSRQAIYEVLEFVDAMKADLSTRDAAVTRRALQMAEDEVRRWGSGEPIASIANAIGNMRLTLSPDTTGYVMVPVNPTAEMIEAGVNAFWLGDEVIYPDEWETPDQAIIAAYRAMTTGAKG